MTFTKKEWSRDLGWNIAHAMIEKQHFFVGVFKSQRALAIHDGDLNIKAYTRGFLDVITNYGKNPRRPL